MPILSVDFSDEQFDRYKAAFKKLHSMAEDPTDEQLIAQMKREASAITYAAEVGTSDGSGWKF